ncbi:MAG: hypothetical protein H6998_18920 [Hahellaceae bacterium]|nr:hypothetical protein [Hahellaceae bacterium]
MSRCSRCGNPIEFRYVKGRCIPLHIKGGCNTPANSHVNDFSGKRTSDNSACFSTSCPVCGDEVFFISHNGGSVWLEAPLGPPWYRHGCFEKTASSTTDDKSSLASTYSIDISSSKLSKSQILGVVKTTNVDSHNEFTEVVIETGKSEFIQILLKNKAGFLLGKLCVYNSSTETIWPVDEPNYVFEVFPLQSNLLSQIDCPVCGAKVSLSDVEDHLMQEHGVLKKR